jgi:catalase
MIRPTTAFLILLGVVSACAETVAGLTRDNGAPVGDNRNSRTAGANGPVRCTATACMPANFSYFTLASRKS